MGLTSGFFPSEHDGKAVFVTAFFTLIPLEKSPLGMPAG